MKYTYALVAVAVFLLIRAWDAFWYKDPDPAKPAIVSKAVKDVPKETIDLKKGLKVYTKKANKELGIAKDVAVISSVTCKVDTHDQTITTIVDPLTGETETTVKKDPYKWLQSTGTKELSLGYGISISGAAWSVTGRMDLAQVMATHIGIIGSVNSNRDAFAGVELRWMFE